MSVQIAHYSILSIHCSCPPLGELRHIWYRPRLCCHECLTPLCCRWRLGANLQGFQRVADNLADTELDAPAARERFEAAVAAATAGGWIEEGPVPTACTPSEFKTCLVLRCRYLYLDVLCLGSSRE